jgi:hypothetical protein
MKYSNICYVRQINLIWLSAIITVGLNNSSDKHVKEFFTEVSSVKLLTKLIQEVLHHPFADYMVGLQVFL